MSTCTHSPIHLLDAGTDGPAWNMALDDALLQARNRGEIEGTWIRLFGWDPPAVTLGRLQELESELDVDRLARDGVQVVRRSTGGKAVFHADELTYSVVGGPEDPIWGTTLHETYRAITALIAGGLERLGVATELAPRRPDPVAGAADELRAACFAVAYGHELVHGGRKICGSAQRRLVRAFLQHGSLLIGADHARLADWVRTDRDRRALRRRLLADTTDLRAALGRDVQRADVAAAIVESLRERFGERLQIGPAPPPVVEAARRGLESVRIRLPAGAGGAVP
jgi:lipoate-protein ligase A